MTTISGPKIQVPGATKPVTSSTGTVNQEWQQFFHANQQITFNATRSGPTASRPTDAITGRWIGMPYFDTTLGLTVYLKSVNPDVWVNGAGAVV